jgi:hypothetical protein
MSNLHRSSSWKPRKHLGKFKYFYSQTSPAYLYYKLKCTVQSQSACSQTENECKCSPFLTISANVEHFTHTHTRCRKSIILKSNKIKIYISSYFPNTEKYCHVYVVCATNSNGFWIYWHFLAITPNYNSSLSVTRSIPDWTNKGMVRSDMSKPALIFFSLQEYTQQNTLSKF